MIYRTLVIKGNPNQTYILVEGDIVKTVEGGFAVTFASSPSITTFYPYHRIWEYQVADTDKIPKRAVTDDTADDSML